MSTVKGLIEHLQTYDPEMSIASIRWVPENVFHTAEERGIEITQEIADEVIEQMDSHADCGYGMTWDTLETTLDDVLRDQSDEDDEDKEEAA